MGVILQWNCRSIAGKKAEFVNLLNILNVEVVALSETWLRNSDTFNVPGFSCIRSDRADGRGGSLLAFKNPIQFTVVPVPFPGPDIQIVAAKVGSTVFASIYIPPRISVPDGWWTAFCAAVGSQMFLLGDFNAHSTVWGCDFTDRRGSALLEMMDTYHLCLLNDGSSTRVAHPEERPTAVDLSLCSMSLALVSSWRTLSDPVGSDHYPISVNFDLVLPRGGPARRRPVFKVDRHSDGFSLFLQDLATSAASLTPAVEGREDTCYAALIDCISKCAHRHIPKTSARPSAPSSPPLVGFGVYASNPRAEKLFPCLS